MSDVKTAFYCQWFPPEPVQVPLSIAKSLQSRGHAVQVVTGVPNFPSGVVQPGYRAWKPLNEIVNDLPVRRIPLYPNHGTSTSKRMLNYLSWAASTALLTARLLRKSDVALVYSSPATAALAPALWSRMTGTPYVLLIQDLWPDSVVAANFIRSKRLASLIAAVLSVFVNWTYRKASHIAVISPGMVGVLRSRGVPAEKISIVYNWADEPAAESAVSRDDARSELNLTSDEFVVTYAGNHGAAQGLENVVRAAAELGDTNKVRFLFVGDGVESAKLRRLAASLDCTNVRFLGRVDRAQMSTIYAASDVQLVSLVDDKLFAVTMPGKIQSLLSSGNALIVVAAGDAAEVAIASGAGWAVPPGDAGALAGAVRRARESGPEALIRMRQSGVTFYQDTMSEKVGGRSLDQILRRSSKVRSAYRGSHAEATQTSD